MALEPTPVLVFACDRPAYLGRALGSIFRNEDEPGRRIFVSQDGTDESVSAVVRQFGSPVEHLSFTGPVRTEDNIRYKNDPSSIGFFRIAQHYGWAFRELFDNRGLESLIILEDDLEISPDFFNYFRAAAKMMGRDPTIWTVSSWNDNGYSSRVEDPERLLRTDFFPGLGWLMTRALWDEVRDGWPPAYWDDWFRRPERRKGRSVIYPEISRVYNFGREGTSGPAFFDRHLKAIKSTDTPIDFTKLDLGYLIRERYDAALDEAMAAARLVDRRDLPATPDGDVKILYHGEASFDELATHFGLLTGFRDAGLPRCSYRGIVSFRDHGRRMHLVPLSYLAGDEIAGLRAGI